MLGVLGIVLPLTFFLQLAAGQFRDRVEGLLFLALTFAYTLDALLRLPWHWMGHPWRIVLIGVGLWSGVRFFRGQRSMRGWSSGKGLRGWGSLLLYGFLLVVFGTLSFLDLKARRLPASPPAVELRFPLKAGMYVVAQGGSHVLLNAHHPSREQRYALDVVKLNRLGLRAWGVLPRTLERYAIYGDPVVAPCSGVVVAAVDGLPDQVPSLSARDTLHPAGNHVVLACTDHDRTIHVVLAHLKPGSVQVGAGDRIRAGAVLGRVGNSGNTTEPHLHLHAYDPGTHRGVPVTFHGRFLVRNDGIRARF
jgi:hypothetical protein